MLKKFLVEGGVVQSDYSVSSLSLLEIKSKERDRVEREIELDKNVVVCCRLCGSRPKFSKNQCWKLVIVHTLS